METMLVLIWLLPGPMVSVPMPDMATCDQAIVGAKSDLNPTRAYCQPKSTRRSASAIVTIIRNMKNGPVLIDTCHVCMKYYGPWGPHRAWFDD
jgi:hypothetical protein